MRCTRFLFLSFSHSVAMILYSGLVSAVMSNRIAQICGQVDETVSDANLLNCCLNVPGIDRRLCGRIMPGCPQCDQVVVPFCESARGADVPQCSCIHGRRELLENLNRSGLNILANGVNLQNGPAVCWYTGCQSPTAYVPQPDRLLINSCPSQQICLVTGNVTLNDVRAQNINIGQINCRFDNTQTTQNTNTNTSNTTTNTTNQVPEPNPLTANAGGLPVWGWILIGVAALVLIIILVVGIRKSQKNKLPMEQEKEEK